MPVKREFTFVPYVWLAPYEFRCGCRDQILPWVVSQQLLLLNEHFPMLSVHPCTRRTASKAVRSYIWLPSVAFVERHRGQVPLIYNICLACQAYILWIGIINYSAVPESVLVSRLICLLSCGWCGIQRILLGWLRQLSLKEIPSASDLVPFLWVFHMLTMIPISESLGVQSWSIRDNVSSLYSAFLLHQRGYLEWSPDSLM